MRLDVMHQVDLRQTVETEYWVNLFDTEMVVHKRFVGLEREVPQMAVDQKGLEVR